MRRASRADSGRTDAVLQAVTMAWLRCTIMVHARREEG